MKKYYVIKVLKRDTILKEFTICSRFIETEKAFRMSLYDSLNQHLTSEGKKEFWAALRETIQEFYDESELSNISDLQNIGWEDVINLGLVQNEEEYDEREDIAVVLYNNFYTKSENKEDFYVVEFSRFDNSIDICAITNDIHDAMVYWIEIRKKDFCKNAWIIGKTWGYY